MPPSAFQLISQTMIEVSSASSGGKISFGILAALWAASNGMTAITTSLNSAYDVEETRPWWKQRLTAIALTMSLSVLIISALILVVAGGWIADWLASDFRPRLDVSFSVEDHSVAHRSFLHDPCVCVDLLLRS